MLKFKSAGAALPAQDIKRARDFYEHKLGLKPDEPGPDGSVNYRVGNAGFLLFPSTGKASGSHTQLGLNVDDVEAAVKELKAAGVDVQDYDFGEYKTKDGVMTTPDGHQVAWFKDSEGNLISLN